MHIWKKPDKVHSYPTNTRSGFYGVCDHNELWFFFGNNSFRFHVTLAKKALPYVWIGLT